jgi:hypothetical protein
MSLPEKYSDQIRLLVDNIEDPSALDIVFAVSAKPSSRRGRTAIVISALVAAAIVAGGYFVLFAHSSSSTHHPQIEPAQTSDVPEGCLISASNRDGCAMSPTTAGTYLGFDVRVPDGIPSGWILERARLLLYRPPLPDGEPPLPTGVESVAVYNQVWTPPDTDLNEIGVCPSRLQVRERPLLPGEAAGVGAKHSLESGKVVYGELATTSTCDGQPTVNTMLNWTQNDVSFTVNADNIDKEGILQIVESLQEP